MNKAPPNFQCRAPNNFFTKQNFLFRSKADFDRFLQLFDPPAHPQTSKSLSCDALGHTRRKILPMRRLGNVFMVFVFPLLVCARRRNGTSNCHFAIGIAVYVQCMHMATYPVVSQQQNKKENDRGQVSWVLVSGTPRKERQKCRSSPRCRFLHANPFYERISIYKSRYPKLLIQPFTWGGGGKCFSAVLL